MRQLLPFATSVVTVIGIWLAGNKSVHGWTIGLANQLLWVWFIVAFDAWGLIPLTVALIIVYSRNLIRWRAEAQAA